MEGMVSPKEPKIDTDRDRHTSPRKALNAVAQAAEGMSGTVERIVVQLAGSGDVAYRVYYKDADEYDGGVIAAQDVPGA